MPGVTGLHDRAEEYALGRGSRQEGISHRPKGRRVTRAAAGLALFDVGRQLVCVVEGLLRGAGHVVHLVYLARAGMAWASRGVRRVTS